jgi:hypothetical protein
MKRILIVCTGVFISLFSSAQEAQNDQPQLAERPQVLQLEATIRGSREQPKVMSIVPWQPPTEKQELPSLILQRIDQEFVALDREEFQLRVRHFENLSNNKK